jgi:hypothetical protein
MLKGIVRSQPQEIHPWAQIQKEGVASALKLALVPEGYDDSVNKLQSFLGNTNGVVKQLSLSLPGQIAKPEDASHHLDNS